MRVLIAAGAEFISYVALTSYLSSTYEGLGAKNLVLIAAVCALWALCGTFVAMDT